MRWFKCSKIDKKIGNEILLWLLNNRIFFMFQPLSKGYEIEFRIRLAEWYDFAIYGIGEFDWKHPLSVAFKFKRSRAKLSIALFGLEIAVRLGQTVVDEYDAHRDIYFPYGELVSPSEWKAYQDKAMTIPENYVKPQPEEYKEFHSSKYLKIYNKDYRNCPFGRVVELALPFQHYLKLDFQKPFEYWEWLGFQFDIDFSKGLGLFGKIMLFKFDFIARINKDSLERTSNLLSSAAIDRYFALKGNKDNKIDDELIKDDGWQHPYNVLFEYGKIAPIQCLMKYINFEEYLSKGEFENYCPKHNFHQEMFDFIYEKLVEYDIKVEDFEYLEPKNNYAAPYALKKLLALKTQRLAKKGAKNV